MRKFGISKSDRVALLLPDGPRLGVCLLAPLSHCSCAPMNPNSSIMELEVAFSRLGIKGVIISSSDSPERLDLFRKLKVVAITICESAEFGVFTLESQSSGGFNETGTDASAGRQGPDNEVLVLQTSGTSGSPKIVSYTFQNLVVGAACICSAWELTDKDMNLNMMPLFHVGGIVRNLLCPLLSGGSTMLCEGFDAGRFVTSLDKNPVTWYYATPTMHASILQQWRTREKQMSTHQLRLICNAGGGLLPSLAQQLQATFKGATILPSYGMTECMPISSPPAAYALERPGTSGIACGPELSIVDNEWRLLPHGEVGNIVIRGVPVFSRYEGDPDATVSSFAPDGSGFF